MKPAPLQQQPDCNGPANLACPSPRNIATGGFLFDPAPSPLAQLTATTPVSRFFANDAEENHGRSGIVKVAILHKQIRGTLCI